MNSNSFLFSSHPIKAPGAVLLWVSRAPGNTALVSNQIFPGLNNRVAQRYGTGGGAGEAVKCKDKFLFN